MNKLTEGLMFPCLLLMLLLLSGALWLVKITRRLQGPELKKQWTKYLVYLMVANLLWFLPQWNIFRWEKFQIDYSAFDALLFLIAPIALWEWSRSTRPLSKVIRASGFFVILSGFISLGLLENKVLLFLVFMVLLFDGSCQVSGQLLGKRQLAPRTSPGKTIEGLLGGTGITLLSSLLVRNSFSLGWIELLILDMLIMSGAVLGDLAASKVKRLNNLQTYSHILPGHGGMLDRFDSLIVAGILLALITPLRTALAGTDFDFYLLYALAYGIILLLGEMLYRHFRLSAAWSRHLAHLSAGLISLPFPWVFSSPWWVLGLALQSAVVLWLTRQLNWLPSHHRVASKSLGSFLFFLSAFICYLAAFLSQRKELFIIPMLVLTFADVSAAVTGRYWIRRKPSARKWFSSGQKTLAGSLSFFLCALTILVLSFSFVAGLEILQAFLLALLISMVSTASEALSPRGSDNLFIPLSILIIMFLYLPK